MKTLNLKILILAFAVILPGVCRTQTIMTTAGSVTGCPGEIVVPINVTECNGVGAISLMLNYDNAFLTYNGYQNLNAALTTGLLIINSTGTKVIVSWASTTPANIGTGTLVQLKFTAIPGSGTLAWDTGVPGNCEYADNLGNILPATFTNGDITINTPPAITVQPVNKTVLAGLNTGFSLSADGTGLAFQWEVSIDGGATWTDLVNNTVYSGVETPNLNLTGVPITYNQNQYRCRISGTCPSEIYSDEVILTVVIPVTTTLSASSICPGSAIIPVTVTGFQSVAAFSLVFSYDTTVLTYTGYQALNPLLAPSGTFVANAQGGKVYLAWSSTGAVSAGDGTLVELLFTAVTGTSNLTWDLVTPGNCEYSYLNGNPIPANFVNGSRVVYGVPTIVTQPVNRTIAKGQNTTFSVTATGAGLTYQWQSSPEGGSIWTDLSNGGYYSNVTAATLNITGAQLALSGTLYRCRVGGTCLPVVWSDSARLIVLPNIITTCTSLTTCPGQIIIPVKVTDFIGVASFSMVLGYSTSVLTFTGVQDLHPALSGGTFSSNASGGKVYMTWIRTNAATIPAGDTLLRLIFTVVPGTSALTWNTLTPGNCEYSDANGLVIFSTWTNGNVTINTPPSITTQPVNKTIYAGGSMGFSITATGTALTYRWQVSTDAGANWTNLTNATPYQNVTTSAMTINPVSLQMNGNRYRCTISGTCTPTVSSNAAVLTVTQAAITTSISNISSSCTGNVDLPVNVTNFENVGSISLTLIFDTTKLNYVDYSSVNGALSGGLIAINRSGNKVRMTWASTTAVSFGTGVLIRYQFRAKAGISTTLTWDVQTAGNCEYSDPNGVIITSLYTNPTITISSTALVVNAGEDIIMTGPSAQLNGTATGGTTPYTWLWSPASTLSNPAIPNPVATPSATTVYTLTVTANNGCTGIDKMKVFKQGVPENLAVQNVTVAGGQTECYNATNQITVAGNGTTFLVQSGGSATFIAGAKILFQPGTSVVSGGYLHGTITTTQTYCGTQAPSMPQFEMGANEPESGDSRFRIYPNPTDGDFTLEDFGVTANGTVRIELLDVFGKIIRTECRPAASRYTFRLQEVPPGVYLVRFISGPDTRIFRLIIY